jgi:uncharacterized membrane protein
MEVSFMASRTKLLNLLILLFSFFPGIINASQDDSVILYTPYKKISVPPGQTVSYSIDLINNGKDVVDADLVLSGLPASWTYSVKSGEYTVKQLSVLPGDRKSINLTVIVPLRVNKGNYPFKISAGDAIVLPLTINVSEQGVFKTEFTTSQANMQGKAGATFTFQAQLKNYNGDKQLYALMADAPRGWNVTFKNNYQAVTSVEINANSSADLQIEVIAPSLIEAGTYRIPLRATANASNEDLTLEVVITGFYSMQLTTPTGLLSTDLTANDQKRIDFVVQNTGSAELQNIQLSAAAPANWEVTFDPKKIDRVPVGQSFPATLVIKAAKEAIAGDYVTNIEAKSPEISSSASFRVSVKTAMIWGWLGIFIIAVAIGSIYYLFRTYGRR